MLWVGSARYHTWGQERGRSLELAIAIVGRSGWWPAPRPLSTTVSVDGRIPASAFAVSAATIGIASWATFCQLRRRDRLLGCQRYNHR